MDISYYAKITDSNSKRYSNTLFVGIENAESNNKLSGPKNLQNVRLNYAHSKNLNAGVDYTYYKDRRDQYMISDYPDTKQEVEATSRQNIHLANVFVNFERVFGKDGKLTRARMCSYPLRIIAPLPTKINRRICQLRLPKKKKSIRRDCMPVSLSVLARNWC